MKMWVPLLLTVSLLWLPMSLAAKEPDRVIVTHIQISGNEKTRKEIILREIPVDLGQKLDVSQLENYCSTIRQNLMNTLLFNFVKVSYEKDAEKGVTFNIELVERWYIWPVAYVEMAGRNVNAWWEHKSFRRVNYTAGLKNNNVRGRGEVLAFYFTAGFERQYALQYDMMNLNKEKTLGIIARAEYHQRHRLYYASMGHQRLLLSSPDNVLKEAARGIISLQYRPQIHTTHNVGIGWRYFSINDTLLNLNKNYAPMTENNFLYLSYIIKHDHRDYKAYPLSGYYIDFKARKFGLFNSGTDYMLLKTNLRKYHKLLPGKWYLAAGLTGQTRVGQKLPFHLAEESGMGYGRDLVRGMEYYVFDQTNWMCIKTNLKRTVLSEKTINISWLKNELLGERFSKIPMSLYANAFFDFAYVKGSQREELANPMINHWHYGMGVGLDLVTYYDKVLRMEASRNFRGETGVFVHFIAPI